MPELESWGGFFLGYFVADQLGNAYWWREWSGVEATTVHHVIGMVAYWRVLTGGFCHFHALCGWLLEATTPFVNQRWFFAKAGWSGTLAYKAPSTRGRDAAQKLIRGPPHACTRRTGSCWCSAGWRRTPPPHVGPLHSP